MMIDARGSTEWQRSREPSPDVLETFAAAVDEMRLLQDALAGSRPDPAALRQATAHITAARSVLDQWQVGEAEQIAGQHTSLPGRVQSLVPPLVYDHQSADRASATVTFTRFYLGGGGAAHGGALPLVFDELLGRLARADRSRSRTAYLHVDYRAITPLDRPLRIEGTVVRTEGRKLFLSGRLTDGDRLLCEAEGLFVLLRDGQP